MINRKIYPRSLFLITVLFLCLQTRCTKKETLVFEKQRMDTSFLSDCSGDSCAVIAITMVKCLTESQRCRNMNLTVEKHALSFVNAMTATSEDTLEDAMIEFNALYQEMRAQFSEETLPYELTLEYEITFSNDQLIALSVDQYAFTGGAHGFGSISFLNLNPETGEEIPLPAMIKDVRGFTEVVEQFFRQKNKLDPQQSLNNNGFLFENDQFQLPETIGFTDKEVIFNFEAFAMQSAAQDSYDVYIPKHKIADYFKIDI